MNYELTFSDKGIIITSMFSNKWEDAIKMFSHYASKKPEVCLYEKGKLILSNKEKIYG